MNDVEAAEKTLASLADKRDRAAARIEQIADERQAIGFAVHADGDPKARKRLDQLNLDAATIASELASIEAALVEAQARLAQAQHAEATKQDRQAAQELRKAFDRFVKLAEEMDAALAAVVTTSNEMEATINAIHHLGYASPTGQQWLSIGALSLNTSLMLTPWRREFRHLPPNQRHSFTELAKGWRAGADTNIAARLQTEEAA